MSGRDFTFGNSKIAVVIADMSRQDKNVATYAERINSRFAALIRGSQMGKEFGFFGGLLRDHMKQEIKKNFEGPRQSHLLNFLAYKYRQFDKFRKSNKQHESHN
jgi:hypothetical protein